MKLVQLEVLNITDRLASTLVYILRTIIIASSIGLILLPFVQSKQEHIVWVVPVYSVLFIHRLITAWKITRVLSDINIPICFVELAALFVHQYKTISTDRWSSQLAEAFTAVSWILIIIVLIEIVLRFCIYVLNSGRIPPDTHGFTIPCRITERFSSPFTILFGWSIWKERFVGERIFMKCIRGFVAAFIFLTLTYVVALRIILLSARETGLMTVKETRSLNLPQDFAVDTTVWNVVVTRVASYDNMSTDWDSILHSAVQVIPLWDNSSTLAPPCVHLPGSIQIIDPPTPIYQAITIHCPSRILNKTDTRLGALSLPYQDGQPDLLVVVNYTTLGVSPNSITDMRRSSITVRVGLDNNTDKVIHRTVPFTILPGMNLVSTMILELRQLYKNPALSALGLFASVDTFFVTRMLSLGPDPGTDIAILRAPEISTLRTFAMIDSSERVFTQDSREYTTINGFSDIGGLWTFASGIFAVLFGTSLMRVLFGIKPISVFGLAHLFEPDKTKKAYVKKYPRIQEDITLHEGERGLAALVHDHLLDLTPFIDSEVHDIKGT